MKALCLVTLFFLSTAGMAQTISTFAGGGSGGDGTPAVTASLHAPQQMAFDPFGNLYFTEFLNHRVRKVTTSGVMTTVAGILSSPGFTGDGFASVAAKVRNPSGIATDSAGNVYFSDNGNCRVRKIDAITGVISTIAGTGICGFSPDGFPATVTDLNYPFGVYYSKLSRELYIADNANYRLRKITAGGNIITVTGNGGTGSTGDGGLATAAECGPWNVWEDHIGNLYISDGSSYTIRKIDVSSTINTVAGVSGSYIYNGDGIPATTAKLAPTYIALDPSGQLYIPDSYNDRVRTVDGAGIIQTAAGNGSPGFAGDGGPATTAQVENPSSVVFDNCGNMYIAQVDHPRIRKVTFPSSIISTPSVNISGTSASCSGTAVTYTASIASPGPYAPLYDWVINGITVAAATPTRTYSYTPANGDIVQCRLLANPCSAPALSNVITMTVSPSVAPSVSVTVTPSASVCAGTFVSYNTSITGGGTSPTFRWSVNSTIVTGATSSSYGYIPTTGDVVQATLISSDACATATTAISSTITMTVTPVVTPSISIAVSPNDTMCSGPPAIYTISYGGGGATPSFAWRVNGATIPGATSTNYSYVPTTGDNVQATLTGSALCATAAGANSNIINMVVYPSVVYTVAVTAAPGDTVCEGTSVSYAATVTGGGSSPVYSWSVNGVVATGAAGSTYSYIPANGDAVRCSVAYAGPCNYGTSNTVHMVVKPELHPSITISAPPSAAVGTMVTAVATVSGAGSTYNIQWFLNSVPISTGTSPVFTFTKTSGSDEIRAIIIANASLCLPATAAATRVNITGVGIEQPVSGDRVIVSPNPAGDKLVVEASFTIAHLQVTNLLGKQYVVARNPDNVLSISALPPGTYFLTVSGVDSERKTIVFVKL